MEIVVNKREKWDEMGGARLENSLHEKGSQLGSTVHGRRCP